MISYLFSNPLQFVIYFALLILCIGIHEFCHAWAAEQLGDPTPRLQGRLTLNPLRHIEPLGIIFMLFFSFGWGKPVQFDPYNLKNPRRDAALISIAGPTSNFLLAILSSLFLRLIIFFHLNSLYTIGSILLIPFVSLNILLGVFNLLPIHPLDGFKIVGGLLPEKQAKEWYELERYGMIFLLLLIIPLGRSSLLGFILQYIMPFFINLLLPINTGGIL